MPPLPPRPMRGMSLQRSVSSRLMQADQMPQGEELWVEDDHDVWVLASLVKQQNTILTVRRKDTGETIEIDLVSENDTGTWYICMPSKQRSFLRSISQQGHVFIFIGRLLVWWFPQKNREGGTTHRSPESVVYRRYEIRERRCGGYYVPGMYHVTRPARSQARILFCVKTTPNEN